MKKENLWFLYLACCAVLTFCVGYYCSKPALSYPEPFTPKIRSIGETQQQLKDAGLYHGRIDYIWGPNTERAYCNYKSACVWPKEQSHE